MVDEGVTLSLSILVLREDDRYTQFLFQLHQELLELSLAFTFDVDTLVTVKASFDLAQSSGDSMLTILGVDLYRRCHIHFQ